MKSSCDARRRSSTPSVIPGHVPILEAVVPRTNAALVIVDPLMPYLHRRHNANSDQDVRRALAALKTRGERTGAAIVVVRHLNKSLSANPLYRGGGNIGIIGADCMSPASRSLRGLRSLRPRRHPAAPGVTRIGHCRHAMI